ncbi:MAG: pyroglutamyl-peptidase I [Ruminococcaceae bacterium]|nr:pyroglutamyl-peptidase I [Oscillospiraceae bacterium]
MRFLLTGFAPFGGSRINPSYEAVKRIPEQLGGHTVIRAEIPVEYDRCGEVLLSLIDEHDPDCVLCIGQAAGRSGISLENIAVNVKAASVPDNAGVLCSGEKIAPDGAESLQARLPLKELCTLLTEADIRAKISYSAGTYVCNNLLYHLLRYAEEEDPRLLCGFIHIPADESQAGDFAEGTPTMPIADVVRALKLIMAYLAEM